MGRGRSNGSVTRNKGGGVKPGDIVKEEDMFYFEENKRSTGVDDALAVDRAIVSQFGEEAGASVLNVSELKDHGVLGYYRSGDNSISLNQDYLDRDIMNATYDASVATGFHPKRGKKSGTEAVVAHEYGHALNDKAARKMGMDMDSAATKIVSEARASLKTKAGKSKHRGVVQMANAISRYATTNNAEAIAEAFADVFCNAGRAKAESKAIVNTMKNYL